MLSKETRRYFLSRVEWDWRRLSRASRQPLGSLAMRARLGARYPPGTCVNSDRRLCRCAPGSRRRRPARDASLVVRADGHRTWRSALVHRNALRPASRAASGCSPLLHRSCSPYAPYAGGRAVYIEEVWGGLFGRGYRYDLDEQGRPAAHTASDLVDLAAVFNGRPPATQRSPSDLLPNIGGHEERNLWDCVLLTS
jgi:hypothetical protein